MSTSTKISLLTTIGHIIDKYTSNYCTASQAKLLDLLKNIHGIDIKRRCLNYHLHDLRESGLIISIRRTWRRKDGTLCLRTSATCLTADGWSQLARLGWTKAVVYYKRLRQKYRDYQARYQEEKIEEHKEPETPNWEEGRKWIDKLKETLDMNELERAHRRAKEILAGAR